MDAFMITIGQATAFAGVTIKTLRHHHHRLGLVAEPERDGSGSCRY
jgi:DNA-binding transcriptional MerR regulator